MAEINNSLAASINSQPIDLGKTLLTIGQLNALRTRSALEEASTAQTQQQTQYNQFLQDQGGGYRPTEQNTLQEVSQKRLGIQGQIGNMMERATTKEDRLQAIKASEDSGNPVTPEVKDHLLSIPLSQFRQYGKNMQVGGQTSTSNIEQNPGQVHARSQANEAGSMLGQTEDPYATTPPTQDRPANAPVRTNPDGTIAGNVATEPVNPLAKKGVTEAQNTERTGNAQKNVEEYVGYKVAAQNSRTVKMTLRSLQDDAERVYTGKGATNKGDAQKWILAASQIPGVGGLVKHFAGDQSDPVAAIENIRKNIGIISRQAVGDLGERSAAALENVQNSLPSEEMSSKGLKQATSQMMAIEDFKQARLQAATAWQRSHNGGLEGFADDWSQHMGPAPFVMARLPAEEQTALRQRLSKTPEGKRTLEQIDSQLAWGAKHGLDGVID